MLFMEINLCLPHQQLIISHHTSIQLLLDDYLEKLFQLHHKKLVLFHSPIDSNRSQYSQKSYLLHAMETYLHPLFLRLSTLQTMFHQENVN